MHVYILVVALFLAPTPQDPKVEVKVGHLVAPSMEVCQQARAALAE